MSEVSVRRWVKEYGTYEDNAFPGKEKLKSDDEELKLLKNKMVDLEKENAILKKAICIFTKSVKSFTIIDINFMRRRCM